MMDVPLLVSAILEHAEAVYGRREIVTRTVGGAIHRYGYADAALRARKLAGALRAAGLGVGDRVATIAWNTHRHFEIYYGVSGIGGVVHTINPRLHPSQIAYLLDHADDRWVFVDTTFVPLLPKVAEYLRAPRSIVVLADREEIAGIQAESYEEWLAGATPIEEWPVLDERAACAICYTSGTTGQPKGVVYSHRSTVLHALGISTPSGLPVGEHDTMLPIVPMFHVNAWGFPYSVPMNGGRLVLPGPHLDGPDLWRLMRDEAVTIGAGVPTVWQRVLAEMDRTGPLPELRRVVIGGSAAPAAMIHELQDRWNVEVLHAWGMTETSPLGCVCRLAPPMREWDSERRTAQQCKQGRAVFGVQMRTVDDAGRVLPRDGQTVGELEVRGPWIRSAYYKEVAGADVQWFPTGDVATLDGDGYMHITDRKKDLIKSGGEWISSIELENLAMAHPDVVQAAVIGIPDAEWDERPLLLVVPAPGRMPNALELRAFLAERVPKWWLPERIELIDALPIGATGKVLKTELRARYVG
jgi:fatty-acyl-CoA synthase